MEKVYTTEGKHSIADFWGVDPSFLNSAEYLKHICKVAVAKAGANFISLQEKQFNPNGVTLLLMLEESHLSIHTYPDQTYASVDCFTCGSQTEPDNAIDYLIEVLKPEEVLRQFVNRGVR